MFILFQSISWSVDLFVSFVPIFIFLICIVPVLALHPLQVSVLQAAVLQSIAIILFNFLSYHFVLPCLIWSFCLSAYPCYPLLSTPSHLSLSCTSKPSPISPSFVLVCVIFAQRLVQTSVLPFVSAYALLYSYWFYIFLPPASSLLLPHFANLASPVALLTNGRQS